VNYRSSARHTAWVLLAALVLGVLPVQGVRSPLMPRPASSSERSEDDKGEELAAVESVKAFFFRRQLGQGLPTRGWLLLPKYSPSAPRLQSRPLEHEDPRRVLIPLRIDPPPDDLA